MKMRPLFASIVLILTLEACQRDLSTAAGVISAFVDLRYVDMNLPRARKLCTGLALKKIDEELRLTEGQAIDQTTGKPSVHYKIGRAHV